MYDFRQIELDQVIIHSVGNRAKEQKLSLSQRPLKLNESHKAALLSYFTNPFKTDEYFRFVGEEAAAPETRFNGNRLFTYVQNIIREPEHFVEHSHDIANFLYSLTTDSKIKEGELHIATFNHCLIDDEMVSGIGFFKTENKEPFLKLIPSANEIGVEREDGVSLKKVDRACLIFNTDKANGYKILYFDKNSGALGSHWQYDFLNIVARRENYYYTNNFISLVKSFSDEILTEENNIEPAAQIAFMQRSEDYFKNTEQFSTEGFMGEVIENAEISKAFDQYIPSFEQSFDLPIEREFPVSKMAVKSNKKYFKSVIKLDKSFHVYVHTNPDNLEKGYDAARDMKYYKLYFKEEE